MSCIIETPIRQLCPQCKNNMMRMYRQVFCSNNWDWVWFCPACRYEIVIPDNE